MDEQVLAERLISYDTSNVEGLRAAAGLHQGLAGGAGDPVLDHQFGERFALTAEVGAKDGPTLVFHGHFDVVPARPEQFEPRIQGDRLIGRGAYDMKGGLAAMMCALRDLRRARTCACASSACPTRSPRRSTRARSDALVKAGHVGDFAITGEPTNLHVGVQAKGVLVMRILVFGTSAHGSTPWLGDNAVLKAIDVFRRIESMPFTLESSELFDRPSVNLGPDRGRRRAEQGPRGVRHGRRHPLPARAGPGRAARPDPGDPGRPRRARLRLAAGARVAPPTRTWSRCRQAASRLTDGESLSVGRDGASDAVSFLKAGVPAVEFGPTGGGHHGPDEWVSIELAGALPARARGLRPQRARRASPPATAPTCAPSRGAWRDGRSRAPGAGVLSGR